MARQRARLSLDVLTAELLECQHGVVHRGQLIALGLSAPRIDDRVRAGRLFVIHRGVYAVGHRRLTLPGRWMAATLALGRGAVLSHRDAGALHGLCAAGSGDIHVTVPGDGGRRRREGIEVHRSITLTSQSTATVDGIPVTSVARTLIDLADTPPRRLAERASDEADNKRVLDLADLQREIALNPGRRGAGVLRAILAEHVLASTLTRNELEERFLACCRRAGVPMPEEVNADIVLPDGGHVQGDFTWWTRRLVIETDGFATHATRRGMTRDRQKARRLRQAAWRVESFTWDEVMLTPRAVEAELPAFF